MICFVDIEHEKILKDAARRQEHFAKRVEVQLKLEEASGHACLVQRYQRVTRDRLRAWGVEALLISGNASDWDEYAEGDLAEMFDIIRAAELPILGFCGGQQLIALAHGVELAPMRPLREGENDTFSTYKPVFYKEYGFMPVHVYEPDPVFEGLGDEPVFWESHYVEAKQVPKGFAALASTAECRIQAIKHGEKLVYGTQFHPEYYDAEHTDGRDLIVNFFRLAGIRR